MTESFDDWFDSHADVIGKRPAAAIKDLRNALYSGWLENAAPTREQVEILARQAAGEITGAQARELMRQPRVATFRG
ncbi:antitoxin VbhA family protein [Tsukamurella ocularis]|uniref:antitoxin VbhA family protein n=1 Tax=Tsukamurella ocularis TaxID=1970234 RepID=UPI00216A4AA5|nr:antitoxin VbhA family protein [Tsukamurella ocularis]MCS3853297.1 hypothetical protein [Tsukamurella ocularis]